MARYSLTVTNEQHDFNFPTVDRMASRQIPFQFSRIWNVSDIIDNDEEDRLARRVPNVGLNVHMDLIDLFLPVPLSPNSLELQKERYVFAAQVSELVGSGFRRNRFYLADVEYRRTKHHIE